MKRLYIRHADKAYKNGENDTLSHDPPLTEKGIRKAKAYGLELRQKYGNPVLILTSPYLRCRQTADALKGDLDCPIICDPFLAEYFGSKRTDTLDVSEETSKWNVPFLEHSSDLTDRVREHLDKVKDSDGLIWIVSHGTVISRIIKILGEKKRSIPYLGTFVYTLSPVKEMVRYNYIDLLEGLYKYCFWLPQYVISWFYT